VLGAGPAGMAAALGALQAGHDVVVYERYREARPAGNILNLWPPPLKALRSLGVDTEDLGAPTDSEFRNVRGRVRVRVKLDEDVKREFGGGFIGLLRPELYERMLAALPPGVIRFGQQVERIEQDHRAVTLHFADGSTAEHDVLVGADGIDSLVRRTLWGDAPKREHRLHIFGGFTFAEVPGTAPNSCVLTHSRTTQGSWTSIRNKGRDGHQWWVLTATDPGAPAPADLKAAATVLGAEFPAPLLQLEDFLRRGLGTRIAQGPDFFGQFLNFLDDLSACHRGPSFTQGCTGLGATGYDRSRRGRSVSQGRTPAAGAIAPTRARMQRS